MVHLPEVCIIHIAGSKYLISNELAQGCMLTIESHKIQFDLLVIDSPKYYVNLVMDWLT